MSLSRGLMVLALALGPTWGAGCDGTDNAEEEARYRLVTDAELACLSAYDRDRLCLGEAGAGTPESACPPGEPEMLYDSYGASCVRASIAAWECEQDVACGETACEPERASALSACTVLPGP